MKPDQRRKVLLDFVAQYVDEHGYSPSYREMQEALGQVSLRTVRLDLMALKERGEVEWHPSMGRTVRPV